MLEGGALSLGEAKSSFPSGERPPLDMTSGVLSKLFPVSGDLGGVDAGASVVFTSSLGEMSSLDSGVPFVVGFGSRTGETGGLECKAGEEALGSGVESRSGAGVMVDVLGSSGVGLTAGFCSGVLTLAGVGSRAGETAGLASGVVGGLASGVGVNVLGASGVGLGIGLVASGFGSGVTACFGSGVTAGFGSGVTAGFGSGDGVKVAFVSGVDERVSFGSGVTAGLDSGVTLGSGEGGGGAVDLATGAGFRSEVGAGFGGEGADFGSGSALSDGAAEELNTSESMGAV